ncbi:MULTISPECIES: hypothetical protein [Eisenbergiella]|uniref:Uncharacterized protein n=1 Tax=Eisenbergiella porci TaxID=2652274 RepID=A0A6N7WD28_9FIRM|nr:MULTISPECIES: hypothetical protein [Eisenbergiella]MDY2653230.1 hypothetical protein [Eisenbergiella porci]MSS87614.1 hypothetical protein [Eisenbergiella porci]
MNQDNNTQRRLELMRLIREENHNNQMRIRTREEILYGKSDSYGGFDEYGYPLTAAEYSRPDESVHMSSFGLRLVIAVLLFGIYYFCRGQDISIAGITAQQIEAAVNVQETKLVDFISQFPYTLHDKSDTGQ